MVLVEAGEARMPIVIVDGAPPKTRRAAGELAAYIAKISGAHMDVIDGEPDPLPDSAIWLGYQPVLDTLFPELDFSFEHPEAILIAANPHHLVIAGHDRWQDDRLVFKGRNWVVEGRQQAYGTINAVYTFIQDYLNVRWLWPGEGGTDILETETLAFEPFVHHHAPQIRQRATVFEFSRLGDGRGRSHEWARKQRLQLDSLHVGGGHAFVSWWERFHEAHPDFFALQPSGKRGWQGSPRYAKLCQSNPAVWAQWLEDVVETLEAHPYRTIFHAAPNDGATSGICVCENCLAWDHPDGVRSRYLWDGVSQEYVAMSDRYIRFSNALVGVLRERFPERPDYRVSQLAYGPSRPAPLDVTPDPGVIVAYVGHFPFTTAESRKQQKQDWMQWAQQTEMLIYRPNYWYWAGGIWGLPEVALSQTLEDFRFLGEHRCVGIYIDTVREHWATQGPQYYLMAQLAWDPLRDGQAILDDYYRRAFGPAADAIAEYWHLLEAAQSDYYALPGFGLRGRQAIRFARLARDQIYTDAFFDRLEGQFADAAEALQDAPDRYARRVAFVRDGFDFTYRVYQNMSLIDPARDGDETARAKLAENWKTIEAIVDRNPLAINAGGRRFTRNDARGLGWLRLDDPER